MRLRFLCMAIIILAFGLAVAEPSSTPKYLMEERVSLFDFGLYRIEKKLEVLQQAKILQERGLLTSEIAFYTVDYDWNENRIKIVVGFLEKGVKVNCVKNLKFVKSALVGLELDETKQKAAAISMFGKIFSHYGGYESTSRPEGIGEDLLELINLEAQMIDPDELKIDLRCACTFKNSEVYIIEN